MCRKYQKAEGSRMDGRTATDLILISPPFILAMVRVWGRRRWRRGGMPLGLVLQSLLISRLIDSVAPRALMPSILARYCKLTSDAHRLRSRAAAAVAAGAGSPALWRASPSYAATANAGINTHNTNGNIRSNPFEPTIRAFTFWRRVGPIVIHYKLTQVWMRGSNADAQQRAATWNRLHEMHAKDSLDAILELRGLFVKIGQVMRAQGLTLCQCNTATSFRRCRMPSHRGPRIVWRRSSVSLYREHRS